MAVTATAGADAAASHGVDVAALRRALRDATREEVRHKTFEQFASWGNVLKKKDQAVEEEEVEAREEVPASR